MDTLIEPSEIKVVQKILKEVHKNLNFKNDSDSYTGEFFVNLSIQDREHLKNVVLKLK